jgi:hypothetical protein
MLRGEHDEELPIDGLESGTTPAIRHFLLCPCKECVQAGDCGRPLRLDDEKISCWN